MIIQNTITKFYDNIDDDATIPKDWTDILDNKIKGVWNSRDEKWDETAEQSEIDAFNFKKTKNIDIKLGIDKLTTEQSKLSLLDDHIFNTIHKIYNEVNKAKLDTISYIKIKSIIDKTINLLNYDGLIIAFYNLKSYVISDTIIKTFIDKIINILDSEITNNYKLK